MKCTKSEASAIVAGKEIHAGIVFGKKLYLYVSDVAGSCRSFLDCSVLVRVLAGDTVDKVRHLIKSVAISKSAGTGVKYTKSKKDYRKRSAKEYSFPISIKLCYRYSNQKVWKI